MGKQKGSCSLPSFLMLGGWQQPNFTELCMFPGTPRLRSKSQKLLGMWGNFWIWKGAGRSCRLSEKSFKWLVTVCKGILWREQLSRTWEHRSGWVPVGYHMQWWAKSLAATDWLGSIAMLCRWQIDSGEDKSKCILAEPCRDQRIMCFCKSR